MKAGKLQLDHSQHCKITTKFSAGRIEVVILLSTQAVELTWDWLEINMGHIKGF